jgi:hypothetical protein
MNHYFDYDLYGPWHELSDHAIFKTVYENFHDANWEDCFFVLNYTSFIKNKHLLAKFKKIVISCHFQYFDVDDLFETFNTHPEQEFLFLVDQNQPIPDTISFDQLFDNVTVLPWITWHVQIDAAVAASGLADQPVWGGKKLSCLNGRQDFHKHVVTAFLIKTFDQSDYVCSWQNLRTRHPYYLDAQFRCPVEFKKLLPILSSLQEPLTVEYPQVEFETFIQHMTNWNNPAFTDCVINIDTESVFNDSYLYKGRRVQLPGPMFTEKTWKPLMAGQCFIPVGQYRSCHALTQHGLDFNFGIDLGFDESWTEFTRLEKILRVIESLKQINIDDLRNACRPIAQHNLEMVRSGQFQQSCRAHNQLTLPRIHEWAAK